MASRALLLLPMTRFDRAALEEALSAHATRTIPALPGRTNHLHAGILLPLFPNADGDLEVVLTQRPTSLRSHSGEICFPGGRPEDGDRDLADTACRESHEEIGLERANVEVIGCLSSIPLYTSDHRLEPFVGWCRGRIADLVASPDEVAAIVVMSLRELLARDFVHGAPWERDGRRYLSPIFEAHAHEYRPPRGEPGTGGTVEKLVFGGTAYALYELMEVAARAVGTELPPLREGTYGWSDVL